MGWNTKKKEDAYELGGKKQCDDKHQNVLNSMVFTNAILATTELTVVISGTDALWLIRSFWKHKKYILMATLPEH